MAEERYAVDPVTGEIVDPETGEVIEDRPISMARDWRAYDSEEFFARARAAKITDAVHDRGLHTRMDLFDVKRRRRVTKAIYRRLAKLNELVRIEKSDREVMAFREMWFYGSLLKLPRVVIERASTIVRKLLKNAKKTWIREIVLASLYAAAKELGVPIVLSDILKFSVDKDRLWLVLRKIYSENLARSVYQDPRMFIDRVATAIDVPPEAIAFARRLVFTALSRGIGVSRSPLTLAAASVYIGANIFGDRRYTQKEIASAAGVGEVSVRNNYMLLLSKLTIDVYL